MERPRLSRELLLASHQFPGEYIVKAFGPSTPRFTQDIEDAGIRTLGALRVQATSRASSGGNAVCVTLTLQVTTPDEVLAVYDEVLAVEALRLVF